MQAACPIRGTKVDALRRVDDDHGVETVRTFATSQAAPVLLGQIRDLLERSFGPEFSNDDWRHTLGGAHTIVADGGVAIAHAAVVGRTLDVSGRRLHTGYVEGVATAPDRRGEGLGTAVMAAVTRRLRATFEFGALSTDGHAFYERLGWERWAGMTFVRRDERLVRTQAEDDGVMVLRFGPSADVNLDASITCESRHGDDW